MTAVALKPKTSPIEELKEKPKENPSVEMSAKDEIKNRGRKIREIKKALKSMKIISRGTVEDKERTGEAVTENSKGNEEDIDTKKDIDVNVRRLTIDVRLFNFRLFKFTIPLPNFSLNRENFAIAYENNNETVKSL